MSTKAKVIGVFVAALLLVAFGAYLGKGCAPVPDAPSISVKDSINIRDSIVIRTIVERVQVPEGRKDTAIGRPASNGTYVLDEYVQRTDSGFFHLTAWSRQPISLFDIVITGSPILVTRSDTSIYHFSYQSKHEKIISTQQLQRYASLYLTAGRTFEVDLTRMKLLGAWELGAGYEHDLGNLALAADVLYNFSHGASAKATAKFRVLEWESLSKEVTP
jgi:hypothetical protein